MNSEQLVNEITAALHGRLRSTCEVKVVTPPFLLIGKDDNHFVVTETTYNEETNTLYLLVAPDSN